MDKSDTPHYKSLCYNCLFKLQIGDIEKKNMSRLWYAYK